jgi:hypothetical protein
MEGRMNLWSLFRRSKPNLTNAEQLRDLFSYSKKLQGSKFSAEEHAEWAMELTDKLGTALGINLTDQFPVSVKRSHPDGQRKLLIMNEFNTMLRFVLLQKLIMDGKRGSEHANSFLDHFVTKWNSSVTGAFNTINEQFRQADFAEEFMPKLDLRDWIKEYEGTTINGLKENNPNITPMAKCASIIVCKIYESEQEEQAGRAFQLGMKGVEAMFTLLNSVNDTQTT